MCYFSVNFNVFFKLKRCICWCVNSTYIKMHGATIRIDNLIFIQEGLQLFCEVACA